VLVNLSGSDHRLLADDALAFHLYVFADLVMDQPFAADEPGAAAFDVLDPHVIREDESAMGRVGTIHQILGPDGDPDAVGQPVEESRSRLGSTHAPGLRSCTPPAPARRRNRSASCSSRSSPVSRASFRIRSM